MNADVDVEAGAICERVGCWNGFIVTLGRGRPKRFCSDECRRAADNDRRRCIAQIARLETALRRERHLLAAMNDDGDAEARSDAEASVRRIEALAADWERRGEFGDSSLTQGARAIRAALTPPSKEREGRG